MKHLRCAARTPRCHGLTRHRRGTNPNLGRMDRIVAKCPNKPANPRPDSVTCRVRDGASTGSSSISGSAPWQHTVSVPKEHCLVDGMARMPRSEMKTNWTVVQEFSHPLSLQAREGLNMPCCRKLHTSVKAQKKMPSASCSSANPSTTAPLGTLMMTSRASRTASSAANPKS